MSSNKKISMRTAINKLIKDKLTKINNDKAKIEWKAHNEKVAVIDEKIDDLNFEKEHCLNSIDSKSKFKKKVVKDINNRLHKLRIEKSKLHYTGTCEILPTITSKVEVSKEYEFKTEEVKKNSFDSGSKRRKLNSAFNNKVKGKGKCIKCKIGKRYKKRLCKPCFNGDEVNGKT